MQYVYVMAGAAGAGPSKVGVSNNVEARRAQLSTGFPGRLTVHGMFCWEDRDGVETIERSVHSRLADVCVGGEWFDVDADHACWEVSAAMDDLVRVMEGMPAIERGELTSRPVRCVDYEAGLLSACV